MTAGPASDLDAARAYHARGRAAMDTGRPTAARRALERAIAVLDRAAPEGTPGEHLASGVEIRARTLLTLANAEFELDGFDAAVRRLDQARAVIDAAAPSTALLTLRSWVGSQRGLFLLRVGRPAEAIAEFDRALADHRDAGHGARPGAQGGSTAEPTEEVCRVLVNRAVAHMDVQALGPAHGDLQRCVTLARDAGLTRLEAMATHNLGYVDYLRGNLPGALTLMARARQTDASFAPGIVVLARATVLIEAGLLSEAASSLRDAAAIFARARLSQDLGDTELEQARCALMAGDARDARRHAARARDRLRRRGNDHARRVAELLLLRADLAGGRPPKRLVWHALRLRSELAVDRDLARTAALVAAQCYLAAGMVEPAGRVVAGLGVGARRAPIAARLHEAEVRAGVDVASGRPVSAARRARAGLTELARYQAHFGSLDLATAAAVHGRRLAELDLGIAVRSGRADRVFASAENARAVSSRLRAVRPPLDERAADLLAELRQTVEALRAAPEDQALARRRADLEADLSARSWVSAGDGGLRAVAGMDEVCDALWAGSSGGCSDSRAMVSFSQLEQRLVAVRLGSPRPRLVELGEFAAIAELVRRVRADLDVAAQPGLNSVLRTAVQASLRRCLAALDEAFAPVLGTAGGPLVLVTTGILGQVPWGMLTSLRGVPVVVAPSATAWLAAETPARIGRGGVVAVSGPGLGRGADEAVRVAAIWPGARAVADASVAVLAEALGTARIVHVAAHGSHQTENPMFSAVRMADGALFAHELDPRAAAPEHVVLSACELGLATVRPGDEPLGLTSVLLHLGSRSVIGSVARVGDEQAAALMSEYHRRLRTGADSAESLAEVVAAAPAPFVCFGAQFRAA